MSTHSTRTITAARENSARGTRHRAGLRSRSAATALALCATAGLLTACGEEGMFAGDSASSSSSADAGSSSSNSSAASASEAEAESQDVFNLNVGDCLPEKASLTGEMKEMDVVDCSQKHGSEIFAETEMTDASYPGTTATTKKSEEYCTKEFEKFVGISYNDSKLEVNFLYPTQDSWDKEDDRKIQCIVSDPKGGVTGSLKGAAR